MQFSPDVERWRPLVAKYFPADLVDKALFVINGESGGNPAAVGDGGAARGLFQIQDSRNFSTRPDAAYLDNPENNIKFAAQQLGAASGKWSDWGEGATFNGQPFGALGNNPYPGDGGAGMGAGSDDWYTKVYAPVYRDWNELNNKVRTAKELGAGQDADGNLVVGGSTDISGNLVPGSGRVVMTVDEYQKYIALDGQMSDLETEYAAKSGPAALDEVIKRATFSYNTDPRNIDATNTANKFAREMQVVNEATGLAKQAFGEQRQTQNDNETSLANMLQSGTPGMFRMPSSDLPTQSQLFDQAVQAVRKNLPAVTDQPYYDGTGIGAFGSSPSLAELNRRATTPVPPGGAVNALPDKVREGLSGLTVGNPTPAVPVIPGAPSASINGLGDSGRTFEGRPLGGPGAPSVPRYTMGPAAPTGGGGGYPDPFGRVRNIRGTIFGGR